MSERTDKERLDWCATHSLDTYGAAYVTITREMIDEGMDEYETGDDEPEAEAEDTGAGGK